MPKEPGTFNLNISYDGNFVHVDYNDGTDVEHYPVGDPEEIEDAVMEAVRTAMSPEEPEPEDGN